MLTFAVTPIFLCGGTGGRYSTELISASGTPCGGSGGGMSSSLQNQIKREF